MNDIEFDKKNLRINIIGEVGTGKTAVVQILNDVLSKCGIEVTVSDVDLVDLAHDPYKCLESLDGKLKVDIKIFQANRNVSNNQREHCISDDKLFKFAKEYIKWREEYIKWREEYVKWCEKHDFIRG